MEKWRNGEKMRKMRKKNIEESKDRKIILKKSKNRRLEEFNRKLFDRKNKKYSGKFQSFHEITLYLIIYSYVLPSITRFTVCLHCLH